MQPSCIGIASYIAECERWNGVAEWVTGSELRRSCSFTMSIKVLIACWCGVPLRQHIHTHVRVCDNVTIYTALL